MSRMHRDYLMYFNICTKVDVILIVELLQIAVQSTLAVLESTSA